MTGHPPDSRPPPNYLLCSFRSVFASALFSVRYAGTVQDAPDNVIPNAGQVPDAAAADKDRAVLLKIMIDAGDVGGDFLAVGEPDAGDLP